MPILNLGDMLAEARNLLDDKLLDSELLETTDDTDALWKTSELITYANEAVSEVVIRTNLLATSTDVAGFNVFSITAGADPWVAVDDRIMRLLRVTWDKRPLQPTSRRKLDDLSSDWESDTGEPREFILDPGTRQIRPYPAPSIDGTLRFEVRHLPLTLLAADADIPPIPAHMRQPSVLWMLHLAYLKNDSEAVNPDLAFRYEALFTQRFGERPTYRSLEFASRTLAATPRARFEYR